MGRSAEEIKKDIESGNTALGIEFGSTRIKAVLTDGTTAPIAQGSYEWENRLENGIWTYSLEDIWKGLKDCYADLAADVKNQYGLTLKKVGAMGVSAMMHGYMAFDADGKLLVPFRTWRNTMTAEAARRLTDLFNYNIPQRWSIAHLYQAVINGEEHVSRVHFLTTLAGYVHWKLTGKQVLGVGDASGMFPIDPATGTMPEGIKAQTEQSFKNIKAILAEVGCTTDHIVKTTVLLADMSLFGEMNEVYAAQFGATFPARSAFAVKELPKQALVEIEVIAAK